MFKRSRIKRKLRKRKKLRERACDHNLREGEDLREEREISNHQSSISCEEIIIIEIRERSS
jgi:hypothetical protein